MGARSTNRSNAGQRLAQTSIRALSALCRMIPVNRSKIQGPLVEKSLAFRGMHLDYSFRARRAGVRWSAEGFPDILTRHMMFEGMYQQDVLVALKALIREGDTILDIGGHHGLMACVSAKATGPGGRVITFEPNPQSREYITHHVALNRLHNVTIEEIAISNRNGEATFYCQSGDVSWNSTLVKEFAEAEDGQHRRISSITVQTETLDDYVDRTGVIPNVVKIDTEGSEFCALMGGRRTVTEHRPALIVEFNPASANSAHTSVTDYVEFLAELGYDLRVPKRNLLGFYNFRKPETFSEQKHARDFLTNVVCVPRERQSHAVNAHRPVSHESFARHAAGAH
jgi:FkbM family methyltransferase